MTETCLNPNITLYILSEPNVNPWLAVSRCRFASGLLPLCQNKVLKQHYFINPLIILEVILTAVMSKIPMHNFASESLT